MPLPGAGDAAAEADALRRSRRSTVRRWRNFNANRRGFWSLWIFLVLFLRVALRRVHRQRPADHRLLQGRDPVPGPRRLSGGEIRRLPRGDRLPLALRAGRDRGERLDRSGRRSATPTAPSTARSRSRRRRIRRGCSTRRRAAAATPRASTTRTARSGTGTGSAPTTRRATCWRGSSTASASRCCSASR